MSPSSVRSMRLGVPFGSIKDAPASDSPSESDSSIGWRGEDVTLAVVSAFFLEIVVDNDLGLLQRFLADSQVLHDYSDRLL